MELDSEYILDPDQVWNRHNLLRVEYEKTYDCNLTTNILIKLDQVRYNSLLEHLYY